MADITQDTFSEDQDAPTTKVIFQQGRDVLDSELNEAQDNLRVVGYRAGKTASGDGVALGFRVTTTGNNNEVRVGSGACLADGIPIIMGSNTDVAVPAAPVSGTRVDYLYLRLQEAEVSDPAPLSGLGELSRRRKITVSFVVGEGATLTTTGDPWTGGTYYFVICAITRTSGVSVVSNNDIVHLFTLLPEAALTQIAPHGDGRPAMLVAGTQGTVMTENEVLYLDVHRGQAYNGNERLFVRFNHDTGDSAVVLDIRRDPLTPAGLVIEGESITCLKGNHVLDHGADGSTDNLVDPFGNGGPNNLGQNSIVRRLNGRFAATIGDGVDTWGDYNGSGAIEAAVSAAATAGVSNLYLHLKAGTHVCANEVDLTGFSHVVIEGEGHQVTTISGSHADPLFSNGTKVEIRGCALTTSSTSTVAVIAEQILAERVVFDGLYPLVFDTTWDNSAFVDCHFQAPTGHPCVQLGDMGGVMRVEFTRCRFVQADDEAGVEGEQAGPTVLVFRECLFLCAVVTNPFVNSSPVVITGGAPNTNTWDTRFKDCVFTKGVGESYFFQNDQSFPSLVFEGCVFKAGAANDNTLFSFMQLASSGQVAVRDYRFYLDNSLCGTAVDEGSALRFISLGGNLTIENCEVYKSEAVLCTAGIVSTGRLAVVSLEGTAGQVRIKGLEFVYTGITGVGTLPRQVLYVGTTTTRTVSAIVEGVTYRQGGPNLQLFTQAFIRVTGIFAKAVVRACELTLAANRLSSTLAAILLGGPPGDDLVVGVPVTVESCVINEGYGLGIVDRNDGSGDGTNRILNNTLRNVGDSTTDYPIAAFGDFSDAVAIEGNNIHQSNAPGIYVERERAHVLNNQVRFALFGEATDGIQYQIVFNPTSQMALVCEGNVCHALIAGPATSVAEIRVMGGANPPARATMKGFDTMYNAVPAEIFTLGTYTTGQPMQFNVANLKRG